MSRIRGTKLARVELARVGVGSVVVGVLLGAASARADHTEFFYQLDAARVVGNASGGAGCAEDFDNGLNGWVKTNGDPVASGGLVTFQNPGAHRAVLRTYYALLLDREDIEAPAACRLVDGGGDAELETTWVNHVPDLPGGFHGHILFYQTSDPTVVEGVFVTLANFDTTVASELGVMPGLQFAQVQMWLDPTDPDDIVLAAPLEFQTEPVTEAEIQAAAGQRIHLRLSYDESQKTVVGAYSLDGEASYLSPFDPVASAFSSAGPGRFWATGDPMTPTGTAVPSLGPLAVVLAALLMAAAGGIRRTRRS